LQTDAQSIGHEAAAAFNAPPCIGRIAAYLFPQRLVGDEYAILHIAAKVGFLRAGNEIHLHKLTATKADGGILPYRAAEPFLASQQVAGIERPAKLFLREIPSHHLMELTARYADADIFIEVHNGS